MTAAREDRPLGSPYSIDTSVEHHGDIAVLSVRGMIDIATGPELKQVITGVLGGGPVALIVDLSEVTFMSSIGIQILAWTKEQLDDASGFAVVAKRRAISRPIEVTGLDRYLSLCCTVNEAVVGVCNQLESNPHEET